MKKTIKIKEAVKSYLRKEYESGEHLSDAKKLYSRFKLVHALKTTLIGCAAAVLIYSLYYVLTPCKVYTMRLLPGTLTSTIYVEGSFVPANYTAIKSVSDNRIMSIMVKEGDEVKKGDILVEYESGTDDEFEYRLATLMELRNGYTDYAASGMPTLDYNEQTQRIKNAEELLVKYEKELNEAKAKIDGLNIQSETDLGTESQEGEERETQEVTPDPTPSPVTTSEPEATAVPDDATSLKVAYEAAQSKYDRQKELVMQYQDELTADKEKDQQLLRSTVAALDYLNTQSADVQKIMQKTKKKAPVIEAPTDGRVISVTAQAGKRAAKGTEILTMFCPDTGYNIELTVPNEYADFAYNIRTMELDSYYWNYHTTAHVIGVGTNPKDPENKTVILGVEDAKARDMEHPIYIPLSKDIDYMCIVPQYALRESKDGRKYIYTAKKVSVLGITLNIAEKSYVTVKDSNEIYAAIDDELYGAELILTSQEDIYDGKNLSIQTAIHR